MQALDVVNHPEIVNQKVFMIEVELHPEHEKRNSEDKYILKKGQMFPKDVLFEASSNMQTFAEYVKIQDDLVKSRGQLGVVPVMMHDKTEGGKGASMPSMWPLALPCTQKEAKDILRTAESVVALSLMPVT